MTEFSIWNDKWKKILKYSLIWIPKYFVKINFWLKNIQKSNCNKLNLILRLGCHLFGYSKESFFYYFHCNLFLYIQFGNCPLFLIKNTQILAPFAWNCQKTSNIKDFIISIFKISSLSALLKAKDKKIMHPISFVRWKTINSYKNSQILDFMV